VHCGIESRGRDSKVETEDVGASSRLQKELLVNAPEEILKVVAAVVAKHPNSIDDAVDAALSKLAKSPAWESWTANLVYGGLRRIIQDYRHYQNGIIRSANGDYGGPAKVTAGQAANDVASDVYGYFIGGRTLGTLLGSELDDIGTSEAARAEGHQFNARLCAVLKPLVPDDKAVREAVKESKLRKIFADLQKNKVV
jgi:hypothetical protein